MDYDVGATEKLVATSLRGGAAVRFDVRRVQAITGELQTENGLVPAFGELQIGNGATRRSSPLTSEGRFWVENLAPGRYVGSVEFGAGACKVQLEVPSSTERAIDLGKLRCGPPDQVAAR
jgi:outer membrane usher protein FimD/PapC